MDALDSHCLTDAFRTGKGFKNAKYVLRNTFMFPYEGEKEKEKSHFSFP
jgi:hypothetical protein